MDLFLLKSDVCHCNISFTNITKRCFKTKKQRFEGNFEKWLRLKFLQTFKIFNTLSKYSKMSAKKPVFSLLHRTDV